MQEPNKSDINGMMNGMRLEGEGDRTPEFKAVRDDLVFEIRGLLDEVERRQNAGEPAGKYGAISKSAGVERATIEDPLGGPVNIMTERTRPSGAYFYHDTETGRRVMTLIDTDKVIEVADNPLEQQVAGPEAGYEGSSNTRLAFFVERLPDGSYSGAEVSGAGQVSLSRYDVHDGLHRKTALSRQPGSLELVGDLWQSIQTQID